MMKLAHLCLLALDNNQEFNDKEQMVIKHTSFDLYEYIKQLRKQITSRQNTIYTLSSKLSSNYINKIDGRKYFKITEEISESLHEDFYADTPLRIIWKEYLHALYDLVVLEQVYCNTTINIHLLNSLPLYDVLPRPFDTVPADETMIRKILRLFEEHKAEAIKISDPNYKDIIIRNTYMKQVIAFAKYGLTKRNSEDFQLLRKCEEALATFYSIYTLDD